MLFALYAIVAVALILVFRSWVFSSPHPNLDIPHLKFEKDNSTSRYISGYEALMSDGYHKYTKKGKPFSIRNPSDERRPLVILPIKYLNEVGNAPQTKLSFPDFLENSNLLRVVGGPIMNFEVTQMVRLHINRALNYMVEDLHEECIFAWAKSMPECKDWMMIEPMRLLNQLFARTAARVMVGADLCRDDEWLELALSYTDVAVKAIRGVRAKYPPQFRFLARYFDANTRSVLQLRRRAADMLRPHLEARRNGEGVGFKDKESRYDDAIQWLSDVYNKRGKNLSPDQLAQDQFIVNVASITSSSSASLSVIYDLIDHPQVMAEIRDEICKVQRQFGGKWTRQSLASLRLLDSFMKESMRCHTLQQLTVQRMAMVPWTFKDGLHLPAGTMISFANQQLNLDDDVYPDARTFDARRFLRKREDGDPNRFHFASVSDDYLAFGAGFHACPGRFLAQDILKLMLIQLLTRYEFKIAGESQARPRDMPYNFSVMPNLAAKLLMREVGEQ
ncbi:cytochrome P450 [Xylariomycetidae sp. FL0641]|nr:cytochrome P450 [Xylariomycetidae sp. FL0641]